LTNSDPYSGAHSDPVKTFSPHVPAPDEKLLAPKDVCVFFVTGVLDLRPSIFVVDGVGTAFTSLFYCAV
jgi:hypothetical protein